MGITLTNHIDLALVVLYVFWAFFAGLIFYLHRENKREGYPLMSDRANARVAVVGFPDVPAPKTYLLQHGPVSKPDYVPDERPIAAVPVGNWPGAPLTPTGNPMIDGVGPGSYAERARHPEYTFEGDLKIVPLRAAPGFDVNGTDPDPRGMTLVGGDKRVTGRIVDCWVDRSEYYFRYLEAETEGGRRVLIPIIFCVVDGRRREVRVNAIFAHQFADVPGLDNPDQVTAYEEERVSAYFGGGTLYAEPRRTEPFL